MTFLDEKAINEWLITKKMSDLHRNEIIRCIQVTKIIDEEVQEFKENGYSWKKK